MLNTLKPSLIPFFMAGYPNMKDCESLISSVIREGVEVVEIGVPFSDPMADGPTIQRASEKSLQNGTTLMSVLELVGRLKTKHPSVNFVLFTYLNPLLQLGLETYVQQALRFGVSATLTVDLPPEEAKKYLQIHQAAGLKTIFLASPTTSRERILLISESSSGFIYYISRAGITGVQNQLSPSLTKEITALRQITSKPIAIGFGISSPEQVLAVSRLAHAVVVGSHLLNLIEKSSDLDSAQQQLCSFIRNSLVQINAGAQ
jgi:tryptophan synthase alpha chain